MPMPLRVWMLVLAVLLTIVVAAQPALAYRDYPPFPCTWYHVNGSTTNVYWHWGPNINVSGAEANAFRLANDDWNNIPALIKAYYSTSSNPEYEVDPVPWTA